MAIAIVRPLVARPEPESEGDWFSQSETDIGAGARGPGTPSAPLPDPSLGP